MAAGSAAGAAARSAAGGAAGAAVTAALAAGAAAGAVSAAGADSAAGGTAGEPAAAGGSAAPAVAVGGTAGASAVAGSAAATSAAASSEAGAPAAAGSAAGADAAARGDSGAGRAARLDSGACAASTPRTLAFAAAGAASARGAGAAGCAGSPSWHVRAASTAAARMTRSVRASCSSHSAWYRPPGCVSRAALCRWRSYSPRSKEHRSGCAYSGSSCTRGAEARTRRLGASSPGSHAPSCSGSSFTRSRCAPAVRARAAITCASSAGEPRASCMALLSAPLLAFLACAYPGCILRRSGIGPTRPPCSHCPSTSASLIVSHSNAWPASRHSCRSRSATAHCLYKPLGFRRMSSTRPGCSGSSWIETRLFITRHTASRPPSTQDRYRRVSSPETSTFLAAAVRGAGAGLRARSGARPPACALFATAGAGEHLVRAPAGARTSSSRAAVAGSAARSASAAPAASTFTSAAHAAPASAPARRAASASAAHAGSRDAPSGAALADGDAPAPGAAALDCAPASDAAPRAGRRGTAAAESTAAASALAGGAAVPDLRLGLRTLSAPSGAGVADGSAARGSSADRVRLGRRRFAVGAADTGALPCSASAVTCSGSGRRRVGVVRASGWTRLSGWTNSSSTTTPERAASSVEAPGGRASMPLTLLGQTGLCVLSATLMGCGEPTGELQRSTGPE